MAVTQEQIDQLNEALASGERQVTLGSQSITYRSIADLQLARNDLQRQLDAQNLAAEGKAPQRRTRLYYKGRGY